MMSSDEIGSTGEGESSVAPPTEDGNAPARGATTLAEVLARADHDGFDGEFEAVGDRGDLRCSQCGGTVASDQVERVWSHRLEGASDPADMLHVSALRCPECGSGGVFIAHFGPAASAGEAEALRSFAD